MPRSPQETMDELMSVLTLLTNPKYVHEGLGPELWIRANSVRMDLSPNTISESFTVRQETKTPEPEGPPDGPDP